VKVLIIGGGGREHALAWKLAQSPKVTEVLCAPGNAGTATEQKTHNVALGVTDFPALIDLARKERVALTIVGPEVPLVAGTTPSFKLARSGATVQTVTSNTPVRSSVAYQDMIYHAGGGVAGTCAR